MPNPAASWSNIASTAAKKGKCGIIGMKSRYFELPNDKYVSIGIKKITFDSCDVIRKSDKNVEIAIIKHY